MEKRERSQNAALEYIAYFLVPPSLPASGPNGESYGKLTPPSFTDTTCLGAQLIEAHRVGNTNNAEMMGSVTTGLMAGAAVRFLAIEDEDKNPWWLRRQDSALSSTGPRRAEGLTTPLPQQLSGVTLRPTQRHHHCLYLQRCLPKPTLKPLKYKVEMIIETTH